jgi:hypothetical protein
MEAQVSPRRGETMIRKTWGLCALALACAPGPEGARSFREAAAAASDALDRARSCADDLRRADGEDARAVARALIEPVRLAPVRGTSSEAAAIRAEVEERLEVVRQNAAAARSLASIHEWEAARRAEERAVRAIRAAEDLCLAASALPPERVARRRADP